MNLKEVIGTNITKRRTYLQLTQIELSKISGITKGQLSEYERFISLPKADALLKLAIALKTDINYFYTGIDELNFDKTDELELINLYNALSFDIKDTLVQYAKFLKSNDKK
jgi:transcriptional regulator with XRE-family HTH domain